MLELVRLSAFRWRTASLLTIATTTWSERVVSLPKIPADAPHLPVDAAVHRDHHEAGYPEAHRARDDGVRFVRLEQAVVGRLALQLQVLGGRVPAEEDGRERDEGGQQPHVGQHEGDGAVGHVERVLERTHDGVVSAIERVRVCEF